MTTGWKSPGNAHEARMAGAKAPAVRTTVRRPDISHRDTAKGTRVASNEATGKARSSLADKRRPRSKPSPGPGSQKSARVMPSSSSPMSEASRPAAHRPATKAPAEDPAKADGAKPAASNPRMTPQWA